MEPLTPRRKIRSASAPTRHNFIDYLCFAPQGGDGPRKGGATKGGPFSGSVGDDYCLLLAHAAVQKIASNSPLTDRPTALRLSMPVTVRFGAVPPLPPTVLFEPSHVSMCRYSTLPRQNQI